MANDEKPRYFEGALESQLNSRRSSTIQCRMRSTNTFTTGPASCSPVRLSIAAYRSGRGDREGEFRTPQQISQTLDDGWELIYRDEGKLDQDAKEQMEANLMPVAQADHECEDEYLDKIRNSYCCSVPELAQKLMTLLVIEVLEVQSVHLLTSLGGLRFRLACKIGGSMQSAKLPGLGGFCETIETTNLLKHGYTAAVLLAAPAENHKMSSNAHVTRPEGGDKRLNNVISLVIWCGRSLGQQAGSLGTREHAPYIGEVNWSLCGFAGVCMSQVTRYCEAGEETKGKVKGNLRWNLSRLRIIPKLAQLEPDPKDLIKEAYTKF
ncbi:hypothetical protein FHL15_006477 [Xylaria flabelliformis]|uniref:Uncharacterized protein n=1 Tax=Xylaria flabelliformis TaxID=2512241 RepID=A0A553HX76_9PEZI|nr:hypothetical protein FHL15_006477 [Xylaria flabelliformis]